MTCQFSAWPVAQNIEGEHQLKAAFVSKFPQFIEWPEATLNGRDRIELCVARPNPFGELLQELLAGERLGSRPIIVRDVVSEQHSLDTCHLLYVPDVPADERREVLTRVRSLPILTIGDSPEFLQDGGIIELRMVSGRVRFEVNVDAASSVGLRLSSQLLQLALTVRGGRS